MNIHELCPACTSNGHCEALRIISKNEADFQAAINGQEVDEEQAQRFGVIRDEQNRLARILAEENNCPRVPSQPLLIF